ncbi:MAG: TIGR00730 family Rossman fold protein [Methylovulum sp.]|nr:TIGR00730 family Rossman fold protein [Methylovulum sp.]
MKRVTVFCGSSLGYEDVFEKQAYLLGESLSALKIGLVYGGANIGLMGAVANGVLSNKGEVIGVLPRFLRTKEIAHENLTQLILVETMHERKAKMDELSDGIIALPGGFGTMEEFFEMLTWAQLGLHDKPIALLNMNGFFDTLLSFIQTMVDNGFLKVANQQTLIVSDNIDDLLGQMNSYTAPIVEKWITKATT